VAARSKAWVCGRSLPETAGSNIAGRMDMSLENIVCCQVEVSATGSSLAQRSPPDCVCVSLSVIRRDNNPLHLQ
jgi:hypothetical protein